MSEPANNPLPPAGQPVLDGNGNLTLPWRRALQRTVQNASGGITELTGDVLAGPGGGSQVAQLSDTGVVPGPYTNADIVVDAQGRIIGAADGAASEGSDFDPLTLAAIGLLDGYLTVTAAYKLARPRTFSYTGDATGGPTTFDGSANVTTALTLANSGVTAAIYGDATHVPIIQFDAKGRAIAAANQAIAFPASATGANPTASVGLSAVNGSAATFLRSDGAPPLDVSIAPTWTGLHTFAPTAVASPTALSWSAQNVLTGTTNTVGANWTFAASRGTGTGAGGKLLFQAAPAGTTGSAQNALQTYLSVDPAAVSGGVVFGNTSLFAPEIRLLGGSGVARFSATIGGNTTWLSFGASTPNYIGLPLLGWNTASGVTPDAWISRKGAANVQFGLADAAAPVAQSTSVQSVVAGTSNIAGVNWTLKASQGTGTGVGGDIIFQTAKAGTTGTAQNALATAFTVSNLGMPVVPSGTVAQLPANLIGGLFVVTDSTTTPILGLGLAPVGGGANVVLCFNTGGGWLQV